MPRVARKQGESSIYHVFNRGEGKQIIFEDDADRSFFMKRLSQLLEEGEGGLLAWCLMDNHFHLLVSISFEKLQTLMHRLQTAYAGYFNRVHEHVGSVFAGRFKSEPVDSDEYLMTLVRYIHENPKNAGISRSYDYRWSSYREYCGDGGYADTAFVLDVFGGLRQFKDFHESDRSCEGRLGISDAPRRKVGDQDARRVADELLGDGVVGSLKTLDRQSRDNALAALKERGLTARQIQRLTGVSLGTISRAGKD